MKAALLLVDLQNDFMPTGALPVSEGDQIIPLINKIQTQFDCIVATQDWHPNNHQSFANNHVGKKVLDVIDLQGIEQVLWPVHCVQDTFGAELVATLDTQRIRKIVYKGTDWQIDSYSGFFDNGHLKKTELDAYLKQQQITDVYICGLATDFCVKYSALDAVQLGFKTYVIQDACRGIAAVEQAFDEMKKAGVEILQVTGQTHLICKI